MLRISGSVVLCVSDIRWPGRHLALVLVLGRERKSNATAETTHVNPETEEREKAKLSNVDPSRQPPLASLAHSPDGHYTPTNWVR